MKIAFDVDGTILNTNDTPRYSVIGLLLFFFENDTVGLRHDIIVWSGGGVDYAKRWVERLGLKGKVRVIEKGSEKVDIAVDDATSVPKGLNAKVVIRV